MKNFFQLTIILIFINLISATNGQIYSYKEDPFKQLQELLPSPNDNKVATLDAEEKRKYDEYM